MVTSWKIDNIRFHGRPQDLTPSKSSQVEVKKSPALLVSAPPFTPHHSEMCYTKHFIPLESDPQMFTRLMHDLGVSQLLEFVDVLSLEDEPVLDAIPRPLCEGAP